MALTVRLFSVLKSRHGDSIDLDISLPCTVAKIRESLETNQTWVTGSRIAVNHSFGVESDNVQPGDEVAVIPPVSGG